MVRTILLLIFCLCVTLASLAGFLHAALWGVPILGATQHAIMVLLACAGLAFMLALAADLLMDRPPR